MKAVIAGQLEALQRLELWEYGTIIGSSMLFPLGRKVMDLLIFQHVARAAIIPPSLRDKTPDKLSIRANKMCESLWKFTAYGLMLLLELAAMHGQDWSWGKWDFWRGWPNQDTQPIMKALFGIQTGYYVSTTYTLAFWEVARKDYYVMQFHHVCTAILVAASYLNGYFRVACATMMLHDVNDIIMEIAKSLSYAKLHTLSNGVLACFVVAWAVLRLYCFPRYILYSTYVEVQQVLGFKPPAYYLINGGLTLLYCLHLYWFSLIMKVAYVAVTTGRGKDVREEDDDIE